MVRESCTVCAADCTEVAGATSYCGDGEVTDGEFCDSGEDNSDDYALAETCNATCTGYAPFCGDDITNGTEVCDEPWPMTMDTAWMPIATPRVREVRLIVGMALKTVPKPVMTVTP